METLRVNIKSYAKYTYLMINAVSQCILDFKVKVLIFNSLDTQEFSVK